MSPLSRRGFLGLVAVAGAGVALGTSAAAGAFAPGDAGYLLRSGLPLPKPYQVPLPIPAVLRPSRSDPSTDYYEITQKVSSLEILPGTRTDAWTYGGSFPGPTIVSQAGRKTVVRHTNNLAQPTVVHLHGGHTPHDSDGYPADLIYPVGVTPSGSGMPGMPGMSLTAGDVSLGSRVYTYPVDQRAATLWYHDHRMGFTGPGVYNGLAGFHIVHDDAEQALPLPKGDRDIPLMLTDRAFTADGQLDYPAIDPNFKTAGVTDQYMNGVLGDVILVNGAPWPVHPVQRLKYRFRLLNASNARRYQLKLDPPPPGGSGFVQIGSDGGLLAAPIRQDAIQLASAERFDVVVDFARYPAGTQVRLVNALGAGSTTEVMRFDVGGGNPVDDSTVPAKLADDVRPLDPAKATVTRTFAFENFDGEWKINGYAYDPGHALASPRLGDTEIWRFITDFHHPVHVHLNSFQVLTRNGSAPGPYDTGWKDTIDLGPSEAAEVLVRFTDYAGLFLFHCHNLEHEDMAMMADYRTT